MPRLLPLRREKAWPFPFLSAVLAFVLAAGFVAPCVVRARAVCMLVVDAGTGKALVQEGDCSQRITPVSTFKIAISLMGFDSGFLLDEHSPCLPFREGYADWGGASWREPTDPARWMKQSTVWFSCLVTQAVGAERFQKYTEAFGYGNADLSGGLGKCGGADCPWVNSSLRISPLEQAAFLQRLVRGKLPVSLRAFEMTRATLKFTTLRNGWTIYGKTGTGSPVPAGRDGAFDPAHAYGWFVGWAERKGRTFVFVELIQDDEAGKISAGIRARDLFLERFASVVDSATVRDISS